MKERIGNKIKYAFFLLETFIVFSITSLTAYADDDWGDLDWLTTKGNSTFDGVTITVKGIFSSAYGLVMAIAGGLLVMFTIYAGLTFASGRRSSKEEAQDKLSGVVIGAMIVFGAVFIISGIAGVATGAFSS